MSVRQFLSWHDLHETPKGKADILATLDGAVRGTVANVLGKMKSEPTEATVGDYPARRIEYTYAYDKETFQATTLVVLAGQRQYQMTVLSKDGSEDESFSQKFLESLEVLPQDE